MPEINVEKQGKEKKKKESNLCFASSCSGNNLSFKKMAEGDQKIGEKNNQHESGGVNLNRFQTETKNLCD